MKWRQTHKLATAIMDGAAVYATGCAGAAALDQLVSPQQQIIQTANAEEVEALEITDEKTVKETIKKSEDNKKKSLRPAFIYAEASAGEEAITLDSKLTLPFDRINEKLDGFRFFTRQRVTRPYEKEDPLNYLGIFELGYEAFKGFDIVVDSWISGAGLIPHAGVIYKNKIGDLSFLTLAKVTLQEESGFIGQVILCYSPSLTKKVKGLKAVIRGEEIAMPTFDGEGMLNIFRGRAGIRYNAVEVGAFLDATTKFTERYDKRVTDLVPGGYLALYFKSK